MKTAILYRDATIYQSIGCWTAVFAPNDYVQGKTWHDVKRAVDIRRDA